MPVGVARPSAKGGQVVGASRVSTCTLQTKIQAYFQPQRKPEGVGSIGSGGVVTPSSENASGKRSGEGLDKTPKGFFWYQEPSGEHVLMEEEVFDVEGDSADLINELSATAAARTQHHPSIPAPANPVGELSATAAAPPQHRPPIPAPANSVGELSAIAAVPSKKSKKEKKAEEAQMRVNSKKAHADDELKTSRDQLRCAT
ncbi:hypothetical protein HK102_007920, partial [Quaeritorhiza haematococci]